MKNIVNSRYNSESDNKKLALYKKKYVSSNNSLIKQNNDKRRLLHFALMEFIKNHNKKHKKELLVPQNNIKIPNINTKILFQFMKSKFPEKINSKIYPQNKFSNANQRNPDFKLSNTTDRNANYKIPLNDKNSMLNYNYKNQSFNNSLINNNKNKKKERKKYLSENRIKSTVKRNKLNENELFWKNEFEEKDIIMDYDYAMNKNGLINNKIISIRKKSKCLTPNVDINDYYNTNIPFLKKKPLLKEFYEKNKNKREKKIIERNEKNIFLKKNQSLPNLNYEFKEKNHKKIKSSYIPSNINNIINSQRNENFFKGSDKYLSMNENKKRKKKVIEYIYDSNFNAEFHFQSIRFGLGNTKKNKYEIYKNYTDNKNINGNDEEEIIVKAFGKQLFLNQEFMRNNNHIKIKQNNSTKNKIGYNKTTTSRKSTEENKNNNLSNKKSLNEKNNNIMEKPDEKNQMKKFYRTKYDKFDMKNSILYYKEKNKNDNNKNDDIKNDDNKNENNKNENNKNDNNKNENHRNDSQNDINKNILNNKKKNYRNKFYKTVKLGIFDFKKSNKIIEESPIIINKYISKRRKTNNDDIIEYI